MNYLIQRPLSKDPFTPSRRYKLPRFPGHVSSHLPHSFCPNMADEQGKLSDCRGNCGILVGNIGIIFKKCSLSCGQHFRGHINTEISWILCVVINGSEKQISK